MKFLRKKKRRSQSKRARLFQPAASKYIVLTLKTFISLLIFLLLIGCLTFFFKGSYFQLAAIDCQKNQAPCSQKEKDLFLYLRGRNIFRLNSNQEAAAIKTDYPEIEEVVIKKKLPNRLLIDLVEREEFAALTTNGEIWLIVDSQGFVFRQRLKKPSNLPEIFWAGDGLQVKIGQLVENQELKAGLLILQEIKNSFVFSNQLLIQPGEKITLRLTEGATVYLTAEKEAAPQVDSLQFILRQSKIEGKLPSLIDLRFDKPVIKF